MELCLVRVFTAAHQWHYACCISVSHFEQDGACGHDSLAIVIHFIHLVIVYLVICNVIQYIKLIICLEHICSFS